MAVNWCILNSPKTNIAIYNASIGPSTGVPGGGGGPVGGGGFPGAAIHTAFKKNSAEKIKILFKAILMAVNVKKKNLYQNF